MTANRRGDLSSPIKRALIVLLEDGLILRNAGYWIGSSRRKVLVQTIEAMYDRYLIKIVVESRYRRRHTASLTDVGEYAAREIKRQIAEVPAPLAPHGISETAARFITEVVG